MKYFCFTIVFSLYIHTSVGMASWLGRCCAHNSALIHTQSGICRVSKNSINDLKKVSAVFNDSLEFDPSPSEYYLPALNQEQLACIIDLLPILKLIECNARKKYKESKFKLEWFRKPRMQYPYLTTDINYLSFFDNQCIEKLFYEFSNLAEKINRHRLVFEIAGRLYAIDSLLVLIQYLERFDGKLIKGVDNDYCIVTIKSTNDPYPPFKKQTNCSCNYTQMRCATITFVTLLMCAGFFSYVAFRISQVLS